MRPQNGNRAVGLTIVALVLCSACANGSSSGGFADDAASLDGTTEAASEGGTPNADGATEDSTAPADAGAPEAAPAGDSSLAPDEGATEDSTAPLADGGDGAANADSMAPDAGHPLDSGPADTGIADTGLADTGTPDTGAPDAGAGDAACSVGPVADYQASCSGCSIMAVLTCASCTKKDQTQNLNPSLPLPCPGATSVQNTDGVLSCSGTAADTGVSDPCSVGAGAAYAASCNGCSISAVLSCTSCTKKDQSQNANPKLKLPCPGTMSVQNIDGALMCM